MQLTIMPDVIVVLGMHRSGTSAVAGTLTKLGGAAPKHLLTADSGNPRGYFESVAFMEFHDELLASAGSCWHDWRLFNPGWYTKRFVSKASCVTLAYEMQEDDRRAKPFTCSSRRDAQKRGQAN